jgi:hypothetical protein
MMITKTHANVRLKGNTSSSRLLSSNIRKEVNARKWCLTDDYDLGKKESTLVVKMYIDVDNVKPKSDANVDTYVRGLYDAASRFGLVDAISFYGNELCFNSKRRKNVSIRKIDDENDEEEKQLGEMLKRSAKELRGGINATVVKTTTRAKNSADVALYSDVFNAAATTSVAFIVTRDKTLLEKAANAYVAEGVDSIIICGDFLMSAYGQRRPIDEAIRVVKERYDKILLRDAFTLLRGEIAMQNSFEQYRVHSTQCEKSKSTVNETFITFYGLNSSSLGRVFLFSGRVKWKSAIPTFEIYQKAHHSPKEIRKILHLVEGDIIDCNHFITLEHDEYFQSLREEAKRKKISIRDRACFANAKDVLIYDSIKQTVVAKWLKNGDIEELESI